MCLAFGMRAVNYWKEGCLTYVSISPKPNYSPVSARMSKPAEEAGAEGRARGAFVKFEVKFRFRYFTNPLPAPPQVNIRTNDTRK